ncbi:L-dopachrome tautomerase-related protein [Pedobacter panaciterrae]
MKVILCLIVISMALNVQAQSYHSDKLEVAAEFGQSQPIGVTVSSTNRVFVSFPKREPYQYGLIEIVNGKYVAYPDERWNRKEGKETETFLNVQDIYIDTKDQLWVLDPKPDEHKFKLVQIDLKSNQVKRVYQFDDLAKDKSALNDVRVDTDKQLAYLSDPGQAAIVILDLKSGKTRLALQNKPQTLAVPGFSLSYGGKIMADKNGNIFKSNVNGIAITKDNKFFYFRPINSMHLYRVETKHLADAKLTADELAKYVQDLGETGVCHGMEADIAGNIYLTSSTDYSIKYFTTNGELITLVQDSRLIWPDSLGIGSDGYLYFSCAQMNRLPQWNDGMNKTSYPYRIYRVKLPK